MTPLDLGCHNYIICSIHSTVDFGLNGVFTLPAIARIEYFLCERYFLGS